jgi:hypothetical protein
MYCKNCGADNMDQENVCPSCGSNLIESAGPISSYSPLISNIPAAPSFYNQVPVEQKGIGLCIASLILGVVSALLWMVPLLGWPATVVGLFLGIRGLKIHGGKRLAIVGIVLCGLFMILTLIVSIDGAFLGTIGQLI